MSEEKKGGNTPPENKKDGDRPKRKRHRPRRRRSKKNSQGQGQGQGQEQGQGQNQSRGQSQTRDGNTDSRRGSRKSGSRRSGGRGDPHTEGKTSDDNRRSGRSRNKPSDRSDVKRDAKESSDGRTQGRSRRDASGSQDRRGQRRGQGRSPGRSPGRRRRYSGPEPSRSQTRKPDAQAEFESAVPPEETASKLPPAPTTDYEDMTEEQITYLTSSKIDEEALLDDFPEYNFPQGKNLLDVVGVKLHDSGPVILFNCQNMYLDQGNKVVVETGRGLALGEVVVPARRRVMSENGQSRVIRKATSNDMRQHDRNMDKEKAAYHLCKDRIDRLKLPMKLVKVEYLHGGNKAVFYFSAEGRIDFRELVRDLAKRLHTRIEMRQIGVRDASRMLGGIGACGVQLCCSTYLREFQPVSIRMAKEQNLVLNPQKVSGVCGRLLCCLTYEDAAYREASKHMPKMGRKVTTPDGQGRVKDRDVLGRRLRVQLEEENAIREYSMDELKMERPEKTARKSPDQRPNNKSSRKRADEPAPK